MTPSSDAGPPSRRRMWTVVALTWLAALGVITLSPQPITPHLADAERLCVVCGERGLADALLNLVAFVPLGVFAGAWGFGWMVATLTGLALSSCIEVAQLLLPGRYPTTGDVLWNGLGAGVGAVLWIGRSLFLSSREELPSWPQWATAAAAGGITLVFGALLAHLGTGARYWGQWTADLEYLEAYDGELSEAWLQDRPFPRLRFPDGGSHRAIFEEDWALWGVVAKGTPPPGLAPILSVYDEFRREIVLLGADGEDLVLRERTRAVSLRLDYPDLRWRGALSAAAVGDAVRVGARRQGRARCLSVDDVEQCDLAFTPGRAWGLLAYMSRIGQGGMRFLDTVWMACLFLGVGYFARSGRHLAGAGALALVLVLAATVPTRLVVGPAAELMGAGIGLVAGWLARSVVVGARAGAA